MHGFAVRRKHIVTGFTIANRKIPFAADRALHYRRALRIDQMQAAADLLKGTHDFASFCSGCTENKDTVRTIYQFDIKMQGTDCFILVKGKWFFV